MSKQKSEIEVDFKKMMNRLEVAFQEYRRACYGDAPLLPAQYKEIRQAFLSGIHWANGEKLDLEVTTMALREMLDVARRKDPFA